MIKKNAALRKALLFVLTGVLFASVVNCESFKPVKKERIPVQDSQGGNQ